jgi:hypothetical protein
MEHLQRVHLLCQSEGGGHQAPRAGTMASMMDGAFTVVTEDTIKKLNSDKIVASDVAPTIGGVTEANFKVYLQELCQAVVTVSACSMRLDASPCPFAYTYSSDRPADGNPTRVRCGGTGACERHRRGIGGCVRRCQAVGEATDRTQGTADWRGVST